MATAMAAAERLPRHIMLRRQCWRRGRPRLPPSPLPLCRHSLRRLGSSATPSEGDEEEPEERQQEGDEAEEAAVRITKIGAGVNLLLSGAKGAAGVACGSSALVADAVHSLSDLVSDSVTVLAVRLSRAPPDDDHPYGHGRYETVGALTVSGLVALSGGAIGVHSYEALLAVASAGSAAAQVEGAPLPLAAAVACAAILSKEALFQQTRLVAQRTRSDSLLANAWHHRSDALSSVVALGGVGGALAGLPLLDPMAGLVVAGLVLKTGLEMGWGNVKVLTDTTDEVTIAEVRGIAEAVPGVREVSAVRARHMGQALHAGGPAGRDREQPALADLRAAGGDAGTQGHHSEAARCYGRPGPHGRSAR